MIRNCCLHTEPGGAENHSFSIFLSGLVRQTHCHIDFMLHFLYQSVALLAGHFCDTLVLSQTLKLSSKATELTTAICLIQTRLVSKATPSWDWGCGHVVKQLLVLWSSCVPSIKAESLILLGL